MTDEEMDQAVTHARDVFARLTAAGVPLTDDTVRALLVIAAQYCRDDDSALFGAQVYEIHEWLRTHLTPEAL